MITLKEAVLDTGVGLIGGFVGTKVLEWVAVELYKMEPEEDQQREREVRPGPPYRIAAKKAAALAGKELDEDQVKKAGLAVHYGLGMSWGPVYTILRRKTGMNPVGAGLLTGAAMSIIVDEGLSPAMNFSAPNRAYPLSTHLRAFAAHLAYGLGTAATAELLTRIADRRYDS